MNVSTLNMSKHFTEREKIIEVVNRMFIYTDQMEWQKLQKEVFATTVFFDVTSLGGTAENLSAIEICKNWERGFFGLDAVYHLVGNHLVTLEGFTAEVFCYSSAIHYREAAEYGMTREFVGSYDLHLTQTEKGWRIDAFKYNLKFMTGNQTME